MSPDDKTLIALGLIVKPRGLRGELVVRPYNEFESSLLRRLPVVVSSRGEFFPLKIEYVKSRSHLTWIKFEGIDNLDQAENLRNCEILTEFGNLPSKKEGEFYVFDLVGLSVMDADDQFFGKINDILNLPANDVLVVEHEDGEILVPFVRDIIEEIDFDNTRVKISRIREFLL